MTTQQYINKMMILIEKKIEALKYLLSLLEDNADRHDAPFKEWYFTQKNKIDQAILKVDIEFLDVYQKLLNRENVDNIGELPKEKFTIIKKLQAAITETKSLENKIIIAEGELLEMNNEAENSLHQKPSKHTAPRAIEAYKKFEK